MEDKAPCDDAAVWALSWGEEPARNPGGAGVLGRHVEKGQKAAPARAHKAVRVLRRIAIGADEPLLLVPGDNRRLGAGEGNINRMKGIGSCYTRQRRPQDDCEHRP